MFHINKTVHIFIRVTLFVLFFPIVNCASNKVDIMENNKTKSYLGGQLKIPSPLPVNELAAFEYEHQLRPEGYLNYIESDDYYGIQYLIMTNMFRLELDSGDEKSLDHAIDIYSRLAGRTPPSEYSVRAKARIAVIKRCKDRLKFSGEYSCNI